MNKKKNKQPQRKPSQSAGVQRPGPKVLDFGNLPTIGLSIIVKNESKVIERMLNSVYPILDYYHVVDTGSTDGTQDIIRNFFAEKGIPGEVVDRPWKNFEDARNAAVEGVKGKADFGFWIDADEQLIIEPSFNLQMFKANLAQFMGANVTVHYGTQNYFRMQFFSANSQWRWYGPVHEVLVNPDGHHVGIADGLKVLVTPDGNSWTSETQQQKYEGHAKILEDYVANDPNKDPRWVFYLAQSYRDAITPENQEKSLHWYEKRAEMTNGFWEEIYYSLLMAASLKAQLGRPTHEVLESYIKCGASNRLRAEHLIPLVLHYQHEKDFETSYIYSSHAMKVAGKSPFPNSSLFIDPNIYEWRIFDLHAINCYYTGRQQEAKDTWKKTEKALREGKIPPSEVERVKNNGAFYK